MGLKVDRERQKARVEVAFDNISAANTITILSLDEMEKIVLRALDGEFDHQVRFPKPGIDAVEKGRNLGKMALYFGCWDRPGHFLYDSGGRSLYSKHRPPDFPWDDGLMDGGLLKNGKVPDKPDGRVFWTCGGEALWYAFYWWDRSVDTRGACNSGFYVRGFGSHEEEAAFQYACEQFPHVVKRQNFPLALRLKKNPEGTNTTEPRLYYIQDTRHYVGNSVLWWRENGHGYTTDLEKAWKVPDTWKGRDTDKLWPCDEIDKRTTRQFDMQLFREIE